MLPSRTLCWNVFFANRLAGLFLWPAWTFWEVGLRAPVAAKGTFFGPPGMIDLVL
jgi:hypothetical protein